MKRTKLSLRQLPIYCRGEEVMNMVTHIVGGGMGILILLCCVLTTALQGDALGCVGSAIYGFCMIALYTMSSVYHGVRPSLGKKVLQVLDHCTIYFLIAGTYTPILLCAFLPTYPAICWGMLAAEWVLCLTAATLTAIDLKAFRVFSMICYIACGWGIIFFLPQCVAVMTARGFGLLLTGGIAYTVGAILFGLGTKLRWMHSVFHIFVVLGSFFQFLAIYHYAL